MSTKKKEDPTKKEILKKMDHLHLRLIQIVSDKIEDPDVDAATLNVARQMLKDSGIQVSHSGLDRKTLEDMNKKVPFPVGE